MVPVSRGRANEVNAILLPWDLNHGAEQPDFSTVDGTSSDF
jgi:hypothetical protein